ncbi:hypothetical protein BURC_03097 [Burkholderiaceae bacterium]|nr:hypothetical protein BURC_03097 [Burkholderiaceae bacterium]
MQRQSHAAYSLGTRGRAPKWCLQGGGLRRQIDAARATGPSCE